MALTKEQLDALYKQLKDFYVDPIKNADAIFGINSQISAELERLSEIKRAEEELKKKENSINPDDKTYSPEEGVYRTPAEKDAYKEYREKNPKDFDKPDGTGAASAKKSGLDAFEKKCLSDSISGTQYYSNIQVEFLTRKSVPAGEAELTRFLARNKNNLPQSFVYLIIDEKNPKDNHFVSMSVANVDGKFELTYLDSNGDLISAADKRAIKSALPGVEIKYVSHNGLERISETEALTNPPLRVQFDAVTCGGWATKITNVMEKSGGDVTALGALKNLTAKEIRAEHTSDMNMILARNEAKNLGAPANLKSGEAKNQPFADILKNQPKGKGSEMSI